MTTSGAMRVSIRTAAILFAASILIATICWLLMWSVPYEQRVYFVLPTAGIELTWALFTILLVLVALHELSHLLFGKLAGLTFDFVQIGRLRWRRDRGRIRFSETDFPWFDGLASMRMPRGRRQRWRYFMFVVGGPVPGICLGFAFVMWIASAMSPAQADRGALVAAVLFSSLFALAPLVPYKYGNHYSDGHHLIAMMRNWSRYERHIAAHNLALDLQNDLEVDEGDLLVAESDPSDKHPYGIALYCRYYLALESGKIEEARRYLETLIAEVPPTFYIHHLGRAFAAFFFGYFDKNATRAQDFLSSVMPEQFPTSYAYTLAVAGTRFAQERWPEALAASLEILEPKPKRFIDSPSPAEAESLKAIRHRCTEVAATTQSSPTL